MIEKLIKAIIVGVIVGLVVYFFLKIRDSTVIYLAVISALVLFVLDMALDRNAQVRKIKQYLSDQTTELSNKLSKMVSPGTGTPNKKEKGKEKFEKGAPYGDTLEDRYFGQLKPENQDLNNYYNQFYQYPDKAYEFPPYVSDQQSNDLMPECPYIRSHDSSMYYPSPTDELKQPVIGNEYVKGKKGRYAEFVIAPNSKEYEPFVSKNKLHRYGRNIPLKFDTSGLDAEKRYIYQLWNSYADQLQCLLPKYDPEIEEGTEILRERLGVTENRKDFKKKTRPVTN